MDDRHQKMERAFQRANELVGVPYLWGGGHSGFEARPKGLDCSGFVSDVLYHAGILHSPVPLNTVALEHWGLRGAGELLTVLTINREEIEHCLLRFTLPDHPNKHLIAARHQGTVIEWYPGNPDVHAFLTQGYAERRWSG